MNRTYQYYVEGPDDKKVVESLKKDLKCIISGKVEVLNVVQNIISKTRIRMLTSGITVILVYDTDKPNTQILEKNIAALKADKRINKVICIPQVENLEDELERSCSIKSVKEITKSRTKTGFKKDVLRCNNLDKRLIDCVFNINMFWSKVPDNCFKAIGNDSIQVKIQRKSKSR